MPVDTPTGPVLQIARIGLNVTDLARAVAFYEQALGFSRVLQNAGRGTAMLRLGGQDIELTLAVSSARPYPRPCSANDPWFQHFAVAVSDMEAAYRILTAHPQQAISDGGPQRLPPSTGSVTAYKFRDPDGHPLELSFIPGSAWLRGAARGPFLGIDHSALAARDLDQSLAFYTTLLGLTISGRSLNKGPEQDRLDGLAGVQVDIVALETAEAGPHIELLHYRSPTSAAPIAIAPQDVAATRLVLRVGDRAGLETRLRAVGASWKTYEIGSEERLFVSDPDGHFAELQYE